MATGQAERVSLFVSHKVASHRTAAERIKAVLESRTERLDVYICEDIPAGDRWQEWIETNISHAQMLLVLWPVADAGVDLSWIRDEISRFKAACPTGRLVVLKAESAPVPDEVKEFQAVNASRAQLAERFLLPLYSKPSFMKLDVALNNRITSDDIDRDAEEIERAFMGLEQTHTQPYREILVVEPGSRQGSPDSAEVRAPYGCGKILNWSRTAFSWQELRARASEEKVRGQFWISEMEQVMRDIALGNLPKVMTSTFRGRGPTSGQIFQPQLEKVDYAQDSPIRYYFGFHEVLVPELVRGPGQLGDVFNLIHIAVRVRWEVLNPFFLNLGTPHARREITQEQRDSVVAKVSGSLRTIELEATRHNMLEAAAFNAFEGADRTKVMQMLSERQAIKLAIGAAVQRNDFDELLGELTRALELNSSVTELLTNKFLELLRKDRERVTVQIRECIPAEAPLS